LTYGDSAAWHWTSRLVGLLRSPVAMTGRFRGHSSQTQTGSDKFRDSGANETLLKTAIPCQR